jgi:hypothetical protein
MLLALVESPVLLIGNIKLSTFWKTSESDPQGGGAAQREDMRHQSNVVEPNRFIAVSVLTLEKFPFLDPNPEPDPDHN